MWTTVGGAIADAPSDAEFLIAEVEGPADYESLMSVLAFLPDKPSAIATNFSTLTPERCAPLIAAGFACMPECYLGSDGNTTPDRMDFEARQRGWSYTVPVFGLYDAPLSTYDPWKDWHWGTAHYLAENVL